MDRTADDEPRTGAGSLFILCLHILVWTTFSLALIGLLVIVMLTPTRP